MAVALTRHFENMRVFLSTFQKYSKNPNMQFEETISIPFQKLFSEDQLNNYINILSIKQAQETG